MKRYSRLTLIIWIFIFGSAGAEAVTPLGLETNRPSNERKIIGKDDSILVKNDLTNIPDTIKQAALAIGRTNYGCTVSHIGSGYALSAGHCFEAKQQLEENKSCSFVKIEWNYRKNSTTQIKGQCQKIIAMKNGNGEDFAILQFDRFPTSVIELDLTDVVQIGDSLSLLSHPDGQPLTWSQYCQTWDLQHPQLNSSFLKYPCDTSGGSSGALLLRATDGAAIGIHKGGYPQTNYGYSFATQSDFLMVLSSLKFSF